MRVVEYFEDNNKEYWLEQIKKSDWGAGQYLHYLLTQNTLKKLFGESTKVLMLVDGEELVSFCTLAEQDEVNDITMTPWIGFVYTYPEYRGRRLAGQLLDHAYDLAKQDNAKQIYLSTAKIGVYEKYGYEFYKMMVDNDGDSTRVYKRVII